MKRNITATLVLVVAAITMNFATSSASAGQLGNQVNLPGLNFSINSYEQYDGQTTFSANLSTLDQIENVNVSFSQDKANPNLCWAWFNANGIEGTPTTEQPWQSSSMNLNRHGFRVNTNVSAGSYQETNWIYPTDGGEGTPVLGDWWSTANFSVTLGNVLSVSSNGSYDTYDYIIDGGKGGMTSDSAGTTVTGFNAWAQFQVMFDDPKVAAMFGSMSPIAVTSVPEPVTLSLLGFGAIALVRRRW